MKKQVRQREKAELHFQTLALCVCLQKACLPDGQMETHTHTHTDNPPALWQNMSDKYQRSAEEEARIIKQKENGRKLYTTKVKGNSIIEASRSIGQVCKEQEELGMRENGDSLSICMMLHAE